MQATATVTGAVEFSDMAISIDGQSIDVTTGFVEVEPADFDDALPVIPPGLLPRNRIGDAGEFASDVLGGAGTFFRSGRDVVKGLLAAGGDKGGPGDGGFGDPGKTGPRGKLGEILLRKGVAPDAVKKALNKVATGGSKNLGSALVSMKAVPQDVVVAALAEQYGLTTVVSIDGLQVPKELVPKISKKVVTMHRAVPISVDYDRKRLEIALSDPAAMLEAMNDFRVLMPGFQIDVVVAPESEVDSAIERYWGREDTVENVLEGLSVEDAQLLRQDGTVDMTKLQEQAGDERIIRLVNLLIIEAFRKGVSDIHIFPTKTNVTVRFRLDGILRNHMILPRDVKDGIISRIKVMSDLKIEERRAPQSGSIGMRFGSRSFDLRVETGPTKHGEGVVLRILDPSSLQVDMSKLGFEGPQLGWFQEALSMANGLILLTGPTGSGKTTTLYSALGTLDGVAKAIRTIEDPVEYLIEGLIQTQVDEPAGVTFASMLRSLLRQDPNIIMFGEIRDYTTAEVAVTAALTGHLVLSTLHTNDAPSTVMRLLNMGVEPVLLGDVMRLAAAQRLVRKICLNCKEAVEIPAETLTELGGDAGGAANVTVHRGKGCKHCNDSGYKGRTGLYEVMPFWSELADLIRGGGAVAEDLRREAQLLGVRTLRESGLQKVLDGVTTVSEVLGATMQAKFKK